MSIGAGAHFRRLPAEGLIKQRAGFILIWMKTSLTALFCFALISCASGKAAIPEDLTPEKLVQLAQEESDKNRYNAAERYYNVVLERFPDDKAAVCGARYEIAFIHYKQKKYTLAEEEFNIVINSYDEPDGDLLPQKYLILSNIVMDNIMKAQFKKRTAPLANSAVTAEV